MLIIIIYKKYLIIFSIIPKLNMVFLKNKLIYYFLVKN